MCVCVCVCVCVSVCLIRTSQAAGNTERKRKRQTCPCQSWKKEKRCLFLLSYAWRGIEISRVIPVVFVIHLQRHPLKTPSEDVWGSGFRSTWFQCGGTMLESSMWKLGCFLGEQWNIHLISFVCYSTLTCGSTVTPSHSDTSAGGEPALRRLVIWFKVCGVSCSSICNQRRHGSPRLPH